MARTTPLSRYVDSVTDRTLSAGDVVRMFDGSFHFVQYVNSSGAYAVPLSAVNREIKGQVVAFTAGGRTISSRAAVEVVHPLVMGGNCAEYRRYVRMAAALGKQGTMDETGIAFDDFDSTVLADGDTANFDETDSIPVTKGTGTMAKKATKAAKKANGGVKREKAPKTVRACVCGCGEETTGHFAPGHDARYHGWIKKLADGRIQRNGKDAKSGEQLIGAALLNKMGLVAKGEGFKANTPEFYKD